MSIVQFPLLNVGVVFEQIIMTSLIVVTNSAGVLVTTVFDKQSVYVIFEVSPSSLKSNSLNWLHGHILLGVGVGVEVLTGVLVIGIHSKHFP